MGYRGRGGGSLGRVSPLCTDRGADPYLDQLVEDLGGRRNLSDGEGALAIRPFLPQMMAPEARDGVRAFLSESRRPLVQALLTGERITGWELFLPVGTAGGEALEGTLLTAALLAQADALSSSLGEAWLIWTEAAAAGDGPSRRVLEEQMIALVGLANRLDWASLAAVMRLLESPEGVAAAGRLMQQKGTAGATVRQLLLLGVDPQAIARWTRETGEEGWEHLAWAITVGEGSVTHLMALQEPLHAPRDWMPPAPFAPDSNMARGLADVVVEQPQAAWTLKGLLLLAGGCFLAIALEVFIHRRRGGPPFLRWGSIGAVVAFVLTLLVEPRLLELDQPERGAMRLDFASVASMPSLGTTSTSVMTIDQPTILVLALFFSVQGVVYIFGLLKLSEISRKAVSPELRLKLIENEEPLFDLCLYIGFAGTVGSLVMFTLNIVDTSYVAAFSSTLFGILFGAVLKILHIRPLRRRLILEAEAVAERSS